MKASFIAAVGLCFGRAEVHEPTMRELHSRYVLRARGFADVGPEKDASLRFMKNEAQEQEDDAQNVHEALPHVDAKDPETLQHEIERMAARMMKIGVESGTSEMANQLDDIEVSLENSDKALHSEIVHTREELCAERGFLGHQLEECDNFMEVECGKGSRSKRWDAAAVQRHKCQHFLLARDRNAAAQGAAAAPAPPPAIVEADSPAGAPGPAPGPSVRLFGGKFGRALPDQGFMGHAVQHEDRRSTVSNWRQEYGPSSGHRTFRDICADHPNNEWCRIHGYYRRAEPVKKSGAAPARAAVTAVLILASSLRFLA